MSEEKKNLKENGLTDEQIGQVSGGVSLGEISLEDIKEQAESHLEEKFRPVKK